MYKRKMIVAAVPYSCRCFFVLFVCFFKSVDFRSPCVMFTVRDVFLHVTLIDRLLLFQDLSRICPDGTQ